jgi:hypothetical protein
MQPEPCANLRGYLDLAGDRIRTTPRDGAIAIKRVHDLLSGLIESIPEHTESTITRYCQFKGLA